MNHLVELLARARCGNSRVTRSARAYERAYAVLSPGFEASRQIEAASRPRRGCVEAASRLASRLALASVEAIEADPMCDWRRGIEAASRPHIEAWIATSVRPQSLLYASQAFPLRIQLILTISDVFN